MLNTTYELFDVPDVEQHCRMVASRYCAKTETRLSAADMEDLVSFLIACTWQLSERFNPTTLRTTFRAYTNGLLGYRATDWMRKHTPAGRTKSQFSSHTYERPRQVNLSLNAQHGDEPGSTLLDTLDSLPGDDPANRGETLGWLYAGGDRQTARDLHILRHEAARRGLSRAR